MLSPSDTAIIFVVALLLFGPERLPKIARQLGEFMRHVQSTTHDFMHEMERAAGPESQPEHSGPRRFPADELEISAELPESERDDRTIELPLETAGQNSVKAPVEPREPAGASGSERQTGETAEDRPAAEPPEGVGPAGTPPL